MWRMWRGMALHILTRHPTRFQLQVGEILIAGGVSRSATRCRRSAARLLSRKAGTSHNPEGITYHSPGSLGFASAAWVTGIGGANPEGVTYRREA